jgi:isopentenyl-diphosphate delta-isomerase
MTGGTQQAKLVNRHLAQAAQALGIGLCVGSQRAALQDAHWADTYRVRDVAPDIFLSANLGAVQLNVAYTVDHCRRAVDMIEADALILHLNPLQEALQPEGDTCFAKLLAKIEAVCRALPVPVIVKEVGCGLSGDAACKLVEAGADVLDVAGAGGTSWSEVERHRTRSGAGDRVASHFRDWGIPTADSICLVREVAPDIPLIASGGLETGVDVAKCIALGADLASLAWPLLRPALLSGQAVVEAVQEIVSALRIVMFCVGAGDVASLKATTHLQEVRR